MSSPQELYPLVLLWVQGIDGLGHATALASLAHLVTALLVGQSLRPTALMRALLSPSPVPARQRYKRVERAWTRRWLSPAWLTPRLVRAALAIVTPEPTGSGSPSAGLTHLALDSVRCGAWEIFTLGVVWHGRALPVGFAVLPYPWPKGQFTPTVCALVRQVAAAWPTDRPVHLVADRAFPSRTLFQSLKAVGWGWTVRLRAKSWVCVGGKAQWVRPLLDVGDGDGGKRARLNGWTAQSAHYGSAKQAIPGLLVIGRGLTVLPRHQAGEGSLRHRAAAFAKRQRHLASKHPGRAADASLATDRWVVLFSSHSTWSAAGASYRRRWATEGTYRDAQSGWDGKHGWDLEPVVERLKTAVAVERVVGLWALGTLLQSFVGHQTAQPTAPGLVQAVVGQWTTTGRLSVWAKGRLALTEPSGRLQAWLGETLREGAERVAKAPPIACPTARELAREGQGRTPPATAIRKAA
jgi:hypothetical protein